MASWGKDQTNKKQKKNQSKKVKLKKLENTEFDNVIIVCVLKESF